MFKRWRQHLIDCTWTYWEHFTHGMHQCGRLASITIKGFIHSIIPGLYPSEAPLGIYRLYKDMRKLKHVQRVYKREDENNPS